MRLPPAQTPEQRLLVTAHRLFCREGIHATGITRILNEAGVARKTLYDKFGSKERLVGAALEAEGHAWRSWFADALGQVEGTPRARLLAVFDVLESWFQAPDFYGCMFISAISEHSKENAEIINSAKRHRDLTNEIMRPLAMESGHSDPDALIDAFALLIDGAIVTAMVAGGAEAARQAKGIANSLLPNQEAEPGAN